MPASRVTHVLVGYSALVMSELDRFLPEASVLVLEEPHVIAARDVHTAAASHRCVAEVRPAATQDEANAGKLAARTARPPGVRAVLPAVEYGVVAAAALAEAWGLPGAGPYAARVLRDKLELREVAGAHGIDQPAWAEATAPRHVEAFRAGHGGECVLKPANRQASLGVVLLGPEDDLAAAWRHTVTADEPKLRAHHGDRARYAVEERLRGPEISVEALVHDGRTGFLNITAKKVLPGRYPVELGHTVPAPAADTDGAVRAAMDELVSALRFGTGILHAEWVLTRGRPHLIECAGRLPGDRIHSLIDLAYGGDGILRDLLGLMAGEGPVPARPALRGAAVAFLPLPPAPCEDAVVTSVTGTDRAGALPGVEELVVGAAPGTPVGEVTNSWQRAGFVIATGPDAAEAARTAEEAAALVTLTAGPRSGAAG